MGFLPLDTLPSDLAAKTSRNLLQDGDYVFRQGDKTFGVFVVVSGRVRLIRHTAAGSEVIIHNAGPRESFAEASLFSPHYHCDALSCADSEVLMVPKRPLLKALSENSQLAKIFMIRMSHHIQQLRTHLELRGIRSARERLLRYFLLLSSEEDLTVKIDRPLKQIASEIGLTHESLYRTLALLEKEGDLKRKGSTIYLSSTISLD
jgi:CRP-like cAMP-binding protein